MGRLSDYFDIVVNAHLAGCFSDVQCPRPSGLPPAPSRMLVEMPCSLAVRQSSALQNAVSLTYVAGSYLSRTD